MAISKNGMVSTWKKEKRNTSKFEDAGNYNWNERINKKEWINMEEWRRKMKLYAQKILIPTQK